MTDAIFAEGMARLSGNFGREVTKLQLDTYRRALEDLSDDEFKSAIGWALLHATFWPTIAELRAQVGGDTDAGSEAWLALRGRLAEHSGYLYAPASLHQNLDGPTKAAVAAVGGMRGVWETTDVNHERVKAAFVSAYSAAARRIAQIKEAAGLNFLTAGAGSAR